HPALCGTHGLADSVKEIPSGFVRALVLAPESPSELIRTHTLTRFHQKQDGKKPYGKWQVRIVEDRATGNGELVFADGAFKASVTFQGRDAAIFAARTRNTLRPTETLKQFAATFDGRKQSVYIGKSHCSTSKG